MACKPRQSSWGRGILRRPWGRHSDPEFQVPGTKETARLQFFFHCPDSPLPIRDVSDRQRKGCKTEPHIEKCAENYCWPCDPTNILGFLKREGRYLFLFTTCRHPQHGDKRFIVGYIKKQAAFFCRGHGLNWWCVQGPMKLVSFDDAYALDRSVGGPHYSAIRRGKLDETQTAKVLSKLKKGRNILGKCIAEIKKLSSHADII
jgi:hypothetical protein